MNSVNVTNSPNLSIVRWDDHNADLWYLPAECDVDPDTFDEAVQDHEDECHGGMVITVDYVHGYITIRSHPGLITKEHVDHAIAALKRRILGSYVFGDQASNQNPEN